MADLFTRDYSTLVGNWDPDLWDFDGEHGVKVNVSRLATSGPGSTPCVEYAQIQNTGLSSCGGQFDFGGGIVLSSHAAGVSRFMRCRLFFTSDSNFLGAQWNAGCGATRSRLKWLIMQGGERVIVNIEGAQNGEPSISVIFDGDAESTTGTMSLGEWHSVQIEWRWHASASYCKIWIDNDTYASPDANHVTGAKSPTGNGEFRAGAFHNEGLRSGGVFTYREAGLVVADTFTSDWHATLDGGGEEEGDEPRIALVRAGGYL